MELTEQRRAENFALCCPLKDIEDADMLCFLATLIQDHDHLRERLLTEPDQRKRRGKLDAMRPYLNFKAASVSTYEAAEAARSCGAQPIYEEQEKVESNRIWTPRSHIYEVRG